MLKFLCKHEWMMISEQTIESEADILREFNKVPNTHTSLVRQYITTYTCNKCGSLKRFKDKTV